MEMFTRLCIIGAGGFLGAILRYLLSGWLQDRSSFLLFPVGTMGVNLIGCLFIGLLTMLVETRLILSIELRSFLLIGLLGSFTTFSTFGNETFYLIREGRMELALFNSVVHVAAGLFMVWLGRFLAALIWRL